MQEIVTNSLASITQYSRSAGRAYPHSTPQNTLFLLHVTISNPQESYPSISSVLTLMPAHFKVLEIVMSVIAVLL